MRDPEHKRLGEILVDLGVITPQQAEDVAASMRRRRDRAKFGRVARDQGLLTEEHILVALAVQMRMFPGIERLTLSRLIRTLRQPVT
jgi:hypothetical protein